MTEPARRPEYDGRTVFMPQVAQLRPGDILLTRDAQSGDTKGLATSKAIELATGGRFSHALICTVPPTFVEAIDSGVATLSLARCFTHDLENIRVLRYPDEKVAQLAAQHAQLNVGRSYSKRKAVASVFPEAMIDEIKHRGIFCSALVAQAFSDAGASAFAKTKISKTTPATLEKMGVLIDITQAVFGPKISPPNIEIMSALDGQRAHTPSSRQTEISMRYAAQLVPLADGLIDEFPEAELTAPNTLYDVLQLVVYAMDARDQIPESRRDAFDTAVTVLDDIAADLLRSGELKALQQELCLIDALSVQRDIADSFAVKPKIDRDGLRNLVETTEGQITRRETADKELSDWNQGRSKAMTAWLHAHAPTIMAMKSHLVAFREILGRLEPGRP